jgi:hypothetical protein
MFLDWGYSSVIENLASTCVALSSIVSIDKGRKKERESKEGRKDGEGKE